MLSPGQFGYRFMAKFLGLPTYRSYRFITASEGFPLICTLLTTSIYFKKVELHKLLSSCFRIKPFRYLAIALLAPFALLLIASVMSNRLSGSEINLDGILSSKEFPRFDLVTFFLYNLFFFGFGEEVRLARLSSPQISKRNLIRSWLLLC